MNKFLDVLRYVLVAPEIVGIFLPFVIYNHAPTLMDVLVKPMKDGVGFGLGAIALPLGMLAFNYKETFEMLSLSGNRNVLIEWQGYAGLKGRVLVSFFWCVLSTLACIAAVWLVATDNQAQLGVTVMLSGLLAAAISTATIGLARFRLREILGE